MDYGKPTVSDYGDMQDLTASQVEGSVTDADFPAGTPEGDLTFS